MHDLEHCQLAYPQLHVSKIYKSTGFLVFNLIFHECHKRGDDKSNAGGFLSIEVGRQLVAERLPSTSGQNYKCRDTYSTQKISRVS